MQNELEATFREQVGDGSVTSPAGSVRVRENVERYLTGLTSSVITLSLHYFRLTQQLK